MQTVLTASPREATEFIKKGGIVAFPTETVYGLGADVFDETAIAKIFAAKNRPNDNPLIAHVGEIEQIDLLVSEITPSARKFIRAFFPAPLTLVLPKNERVPMAATANLDTVGVRMPQNDLAREFLKWCNAPLVAPSANLSGRPSPTTREAVYEDLNERIDCILQGAPTQIGLESTVVDCTGAAPLVLRQGAISLEDLQKSVPETQNYRIKESEAARSPGLKHRHYSPRARVILTNNQRQTTEGQRTEDEGQTKAFIGLNQPSGDFNLKKICRSVEEYARAIFEFFRECDRQNVSAIYCEIVAETGIGAALMDRLRRAARG